RLIKLNLIRTWVDDRQQCAFLYRLAFLEFHIDKLPVHSALYAHRVISFNGTQAGQVDWQVLPQRGSNRDLPRLGGIGSGTRRAGVRSRTRRKKRRQK